jgi:hypothetical protein
MHPRKLAFHQLCIYLAMATLTCGLQTCSNGYSEVFGRVLWNYLKFLKNHDYIQEPIIWCDSHILNFKNHPTLVRTNVGQFWFFCQQLCTQMNQACAWAWSLELELGAWKEYYFYNFQILTYILGATRWIMDECLWMND